MSQNRDIGHPAIRSHFPDRLLQFIGLGATSPAQPADFSLSGAHPMQKYFGALTILLLLGLVLARVSMLKKRGIKAMHFGGTDKSDFLIPPFALFYFYTVFANAFGFWTPGGTAFFQSGIAGWVGVFSCLAGLILMYWSLVSF